MAKLFSINKLIDKITELIKVKTDQLKIEVMSHVAKILAHVITYIILGLILFFLAFFLTFTLAVYLNHILDSPFYGYLIVCGIMLLELIILVLLLRTGKFQRWLESMILNIGESDD